MKRKKLVVTGLMAGVLLTAVVPTFANSLYGGKTEKNISGENVITIISEEDSRFLVEDMEVPSNTYILDEKIADVTGDEVDDIIYLIGHKGNTADRYADKLNVVVRNGATNKREMTDLKKIGGYEGKLFVGDFSGDKVKDVMITAPTGGSGGIVQHIIVNFNTPEPTVIFGTTNNAGAQFTGKYVDGFKAELVNQNTGRSILIDLNVKKDMYVAAQIYNKEGALLKEVKPMIYPLSLLEPIDIDRDGTYELKGTQSIKGAYGADTISHVNSFWKFENKQWTAKQIEVSSFLLTVNETRLVPTVVAGYNIVRRSIKTDSAEIYYPQVENMQGILTMEYINQDLHNAVKKYLTDASPNAKVFIDYEVMRQDNDMISIVFKGRQPWEGGEYKILASVNEDIKSRNQLFVKNLIKSDPESRNAMTELLKTAASKNPNIKKLPELGDWMGIYFTKDDLVFYYLENDFSTEHIKIIVPLEKARQHFNHKIGSVYGVEF